MNDIPDPEKVGAGYYDERNVVNLDFYINFSSSKLFVTYHCYRYVERVGRKFCDQSR